MLTIGTSTELQSQDPFPLPLIEEFLDRLGKARYISTLDLLKGYHQVPVHADSVAKTAFITNQGKWEYLCMPFGLKNAPSVFQRLMNAIVADLTEYAAAYINNLIIFSETFGDHIQHLRTVLQRLQETGLTLKPGKCFFAENSCCFLGNVVGEGQI